MVESAEAKKDGQLVLDIYAHFRSKAGQVLRANNFLAVGSRQHIPIARIRNGIEYAEKTQWIEQTDNGSLRLTNQGFAAMRRSV